MPNVILIYPRTLWDVKNVTTRLPLSCLYIGSVLQAHGFSVQVIDQRVDDYWPETLSRAVKKRPLWVGVGPMTGRQIQWSLDASRLVRKTNPDVPIVWGGVHSTILPEQTLAHPLVDMVVVGEGEITSLELTSVLHAVRQSGNVDSAVFRNIAGLVWHHNGRTIRNAHRAARPMDEWPFLDYGLVNTDHYILSEIPGERSLQITTSRGCPRKCAYCYLTVVPDGRRYRAESPCRTIERMERLIRLFNLNAIHIIDDEFFTQRKRAVKVCELIIERGINVSLRTNCRIDYADQMSRADLDLIRRAGFKNIYLGAESSSDRILKFIKKEITSDQIIKVNKKFKEAGISPKYSFMGGFPTETITEIKETVSLMANLVHDNPNAYTTPLQLYSPYPGTQLYDHCLKSGMKMPARLEEWATLGWEKIDYSCLSKHEKQFLEKAAYFTFFLDGKTVPESMKSPVMKMATKAYSRLIRMRIKRNFFAFMPEVKLIQWKLENTH